MSPPACDDPPAGATVWYVDGATGDDGNDGSSPTTAFKTIGRAVSGGSAPVGPGDVVMIKGGLYRERVDMAKSGTAQSRILVRPLDDVEVIVDGSDEVASWSLVSGDTYRATPGFDVQAVVVDDTPLFPGTSAATLTAGFYFYNAGTGALSVNLPQGGAPDPSRIGVIAVDDNKTQQAFFLDHASYVTLCGLTTRFAGAKGVQILGDHDRIEQGKVVFNGGIGLSIFPYGGIESTDAEIVSNEIAYNYMRNWPRCANGNKYGGWGTGASSQAVPNTSYVGNLVHHNGGEGLVASGSTSGALFRNNVVFDNWSVNIYLLNEKNATIEGNFVFSHAPDLTLLTNNGDPDPTDGQCAKRLRPDGIDTGDEDIGTSLLMSDVLIANNLVVGSHNGLSHVAEVTGSGLKNVHVLFNTIVVPSSFGANESPVGINVPANDGNNAGSEYRDNIVVATGGQGLLAHSDASAGDPFHGLTFDHNLFFSAALAKPIHWGSTSLTHATWIALASGQGQGDLTSDPALGDAESFEPTSKCPPATSPTVDAGADASIATDYFGTARPAGGGFDLGACEVVP